MDLRARPGAAFLFDKGQPTPDAYRFLASPDKPAAESQKAPEQPAPPQTPAAKLRAQFPPAPKPGHPLDPADVDVLTGKPKSLACIGPTHLSSFRQLVPADSGSEPRWGRPGARMRDYLRKLDVLFARQREEDAGWPHNAVFPKDLVQPCILARCDPSDHESRACGM